MGRRGDVHRGVYRRTRVVSGFAKDECLEAITQEANVALVDMFDANETAAAASVKASVAIRYGEQDAPCGCIWFREWAPNSRRHNL